MSSPAKLSRAVFLDRDGVIIEDVDWLTHPGQIHVLPGVPQALRRLAQTGFRLIVATNQPIIARGFATEAQLEALHAAMAAQLTAAGAAAGCRTVLVQTGKHLLPPIQTAEPLDPGLKPDWTCADLPAAAEWIVNRK